jgi:pantoate--beta-alanine ligase
MYSKEELSNKWQKIDFGLLDKTMEGKHRPGHFNGMAQIVSKLFNIVKPKRAYFGLKDFQQLVIIKEMVKQMKFPVEIVSCPIVREKDGLAMSSRNMRLNLDERKAAAKISQILFKVKEISNQESEVQKLKTIAESEIKQEKLFDLEYFEIVDAENLQPVNFIFESKETVACVAIKLGTVRLIDNVLL